VAGGDAAQPHDPDRRLDYSGPANRSHSLRSHSVFIRRPCRLERGVPLPEVSQRFLPTIWPVLLILLITGSLLIVGEPQRSLVNSTFFLKMALLAVAILLTAGLQRSITSSPNFWDHDRTSPCLFGAAFCSPV
jgi:hypothetical protein